MIMRAENKLACCWLGLGAHSASRWWLETIILCLHILSIMIIMFTAELDHSACNVESLNNNDDVATAAVACILFCLKNVVSVRVARVKFAPYTLRR